MEAPRVSTATLPICAILVLVRSFGKVNRDVRTFIASADAVGAPPFLTAAAGFPFVLLMTVPGFLALIGGAYRAAGCKRRVAVSPVGAGPSTPRQPRRLPVWPLIFQYSSSPTCACSTP